MPINSSQMRMLFVPSDTQGGSFYRMQTPASTLQESGYAHALCHMMAYDEESIKSLNPDVIVFQHPTTDREIQVLRNYRRALPKAHFVYDIDDNWLAVPDESAHKQHLPKDIKARIVAAANLCNSITVTTEPLKKVMQGISSVKDIRVLPNYIPANTLQNMTRTRKQYRTGNKKIRVGWVGGVGHGGDIKLLDSLLYKLHDTVDWVFMGMTPETCDPRLFEIHAPVDVQMYHAKLASLNLDIALSPLANNDFNISKSNLRVLEYGAAGIAVLASAIEPYNSFENIQKLPFVADVWEAAIRNLANNLDLVDDMAEKLHEDINQNW
ncbi:MAG: hypothetical protein KGH75_12900, partial [Rhodospirillales bacterium]|nr:hypothetical protein [Rhodospirillales bacterium]